MQVGSQPSGGWGRLTFVAGDDGLLLRRPLSASRTPSGVLQTSRLEFSVSSLNNILFVYAPKRGLGGGGGGGGGSGGWGGTETQKRCSTFASRIDC